MMTVCNAKAAFGNAEFVAGAEAFGDYPRITHLMSWASLTGCPCTRKPRRKTRPAANTSTTVVVREIATAIRICQVGKPGGIAMRATVIIGAESGKNVAIVGSG